MSTPSHGELARRLEGISIYLVGMMGAGKSAAGRPLAEALGYRFLDADTALEQVAGRSIPEIFACDGEAGFRALETAVLAQITGWHSLVVATGGGVVTRPENWGHLRQGLVVWLDAPSDVLLERLASDPTPRPLMQAADPEAQLQALLAQRRPLYGQADLRVLQSGERPEQVAARVLEAIPSVLRQRQAPPQQPVLLENADGQITASLN
ncbi:MAG: shikimate kinase [Cyanobacteriota bacterium]|nr:shikimate kinase [Cyanobacteriota bacterium]